MTNTPGDQPPQDPSNDPSQQPPPQPSQQPPSGQPGYWEQQAQQPGEQPGQQPGQQPGRQPGQYGYPPQQGYPPQAPMQYAPDHPRATTSLVLGILGIVLCQVIAPFAWVIGKKTVDEIDASRGALGGRGAAQAGYVMGVIGSALLGLGLVILVIWVVIAVIAIGTSTTS